MAPPAPGVHVRPDRGLGEFAGFHVLGVHPTAQPASGRQNLDCRPRRVAALQQPAAKPIHERAHPTGLDPRSQHASASIPPGPDAPRIKGCSLGSGHVTQIWGQQLAPGGTAFAGGTSAPSGTRRAEFDPYRSAISASASSAHPRSPRDPGTPVGLKREFRHSATRSGDQILRDSPARFPDYYVALGSPWCLRPVTCMVPRAVFARNVPPKGTP
jgi:hypothetical protein